VLAAVPAAITRLFVRAESQQIRVIRVIRGLAKNPNFPRNLAQDFLQYTCVKTQVKEDQNKKGQQIT
jgi:hypothetical protein